MIESPERQPRPDDADDIDRVTSSLIARFPELPLRTVRHSVERNHHAFDGRPIRRYLAILIERAARTELEETARINGELRPESDRENGEDL